MKVFVIRVNVHVCSSSVYSLLTNSFLNKKYCLLCAVLLICVYYHYEDLFTVFCKNKEHMLPIKKCFIGHFGDLFTIYKIRR